MEQLQQFFNTNTENLVKILVDEKLKNGYGALFISIKRNLDETPKSIDVYYLKMIQIPNQIRTDLIQKYHDANSDTNICFFVLFDKNTSIIIEHKIE
jgi:hypothetical protein